MKTPVSHVLAPLWLAAIGFGFWSSTAASAASTDRISLAGQWRFELDRTGVGIRERWFERELPGKIKLPGSLPAQGIGDEVTVDTKWTGEIVDRSWFTAPEYARYRQAGTVKVPFWLQPEKYYAGAAWYQREVEIPQDWTRKRALLTLERPHWETRVWLDGQELGANNSLSTPHEYDLGTKIGPGKHRLTIRVDNSLVVDVGVNSHSISDHTQGNWNGIVGRIEIRCDPPPWSASAGLVSIEDLQVFPSLAGKSAKVRIKVSNRSGQPLSTSISLSAAPFNNVTSAPPCPPHTFTARIETPGSTLESELPLGELVYRWDEFQPFLYRLEARLDGKQGESLVIAAKSAVFGMREISTQGTQFLINGRKTFFRGTLECCIFPKTGHPPTDVEAWKRILRIAKGYGLNLIRFHSWCPPEAAFVAADELGFYYQVEIASWANSSTSLGDGKPVDQWLYQEADRMLKAYGNHPSFVLMPYGNEPGGKNANAWLAQWVNHWKATDPRRLYTSGSGWPQLPENQFHVTPDPRIQAWGGGLNSRINALPPETRTDYHDYIRQRSVPVISHEIGQWCVYPNFEEIPKYSGYLKPKNFEIFRESLAAHGLADLAHQFLLASGKLQTLCYKEDIESALRTPGMGGFELLDLHDFPGQGTALVGVLDPFWEDKGYVTGEEFSRFCGATVPLARLARRVFTTDETLEADLEVAHFGAAPLANAAVSWKLVDDHRKPVARGDLPARDLPVDNGIVLGRLSLPLQAMAAPARYKLVLNVRPGSHPDSKGFENDWDIWVYPAQVDTRPPGDAIVTNELSDQVANALQAGGKVLLTVPANRVKGDRLGKVAFGFSSIFWNTAWTGRQPPHTLGILCDPKHPALAQFPTDYASNWQWWYVIHHAGAMILDDLPRELRPTVQVIDDWVTNRKLGLIFEAKVGSGKLIVCSADLTQEQDQNPVNRQLLRSLVSYMGTKKFNPRVSLSIHQVKNLLAGPTTLQKHGGRVVKVDTYQEGFEAAKAIDGDPATFWHTAWEPTATGFPHELQIELETPARLRGLKALPRQDGNPNGWIKEYEVYTSQDGQNWGRPVARGVFSPGPDSKLLEWSEPVTTRFIRLVALSGHSNGPWTSLAELDLVE